MTAETIFTNRLSNNMTLLKRCVCYCLLYKWVGFRLYFDLLRCHFVGVILSAARTRDAESLVWKSTISDKVCKVLEQRVVLVLQYKS